MLWIALFVGVAVLAAYLRKGYFRGRPFWLDEAWVVDSVRASPWSVFEMSSTGPPVWELMLRLVPGFGGPERYRLLPFAWSVATVAPAAAIGAMIGKTSRARLWYALGAALAVAVLPQMIVRQDLKQFTAEAFVALALLWLIARAEAEWSVQRLLVAGLIGIPVVLIASTAAFVNAALLASLCLCLVLDRRWRPLVITAVTSVVVVGMNALLLLTVSLTGPAEQLRDYWKNDFIPLNRGASNAWNFVVGRLSREAAYTHLPSLLILGLILAGIVVLWVRGHRVPALAGPALFAGMTLAAALQIYPFMDRRTSLFLVTILAIYVGVAVVGMAATLTRRRSGIAVVIAGLMGLAIPLGAAARVAMRPSVPYENVRDQVAYLQRHRQTGDVVVVGFPASFGFAYYWPDPPTFVSQPRPEPLVTFAVTYPRDRSIVIASYQNPEDIRAALTAAFARVSPDGRVWVVLSHDRPASWLALAPRPTRARQVRLKLGPSDALLELRTFSR